MDEKILWELFRDTGEPLIWLLARALREEKDREGTGEPVPGK